MFLSLISTTTSSAPDTTSVLPRITGVDALTSIWIVPTVLFGLLAGWVATWIAHRYRVGEDADGYEIAVLDNATCPHCDHVVTLAEAAPLRSIRCGSCHQRMSLSWPIAQAAVVVGSVAMLATWGAGLVLLPFLWLVPVVITAGTTDFRTMLIPKKVVWVGFFVGLAGIVVVSLSWGAPSLITHALIGSAAYFGFLFIAHLVNPGGMGFGDVRLALVLGLYLGWIDIRLPLFGLLLGNIAYLAYALPQRIKKGKEHGQFSPFGPGLAIGTLLAVCFQSFLV